MNGEQLPIWPGDVAPPAASDCWQTPESFLTRVRQVGPIALDPCTTKENPTRALYIRTPDCHPDGLMTDWRYRADDGLVFVNPPYSDPMPWARKIVEEARWGAEVLSLMPGDTSTEWARVMLRAADLVCFPPRIKFQGAKGSPNFWNAVYYMGKRTAGFVSAFHPYPVVRPV